MGKIFYTSDLHFGHFNSIRFDKRPWSTVEEMDEGLVERWNAKVGNDDHVYILGDISWYKGSTKTVELLKRLNGKKTLLRGNHDYSDKPELLACFDKVVDYLEIRDGKYNVVLSHYPMLFYKNQRYGWIHLYGHLHCGMDEDLCQEFIEKVKAAGINTHMYNVGTMLWDFAPITLAEIFEKFQNIPF